MRKPIRVLYVDTYTHTTPVNRPVSSDAIGYGVTSSGAIVSRLRTLGCEVCVIRPRAAESTNHPDSELRLRGVLKAYQEILDALKKSAPDVIFVFHSFVVYPAEILRIMHDIGVHAPIVGYTHGSHWDPTDTFRFDHYPGLEMQDLANFTAMDRIFVVSNYMRDTLAAGIRVVNSSIAEDIVSKISVIGLPLNTALIDRERADTHTQSPTIVFNHAPVRSKRPDLFATVMHEIMPARDIRVLFTRRFGTDDCGADEVSVFGSEVRQSSAPR